MLPSNQRSNSDIHETLSHVKPSVAFVVMIFGALIAFEIFNYSTTDHALNDLLGDLTFAGIPWATILALAFCGIDFAGIARLFTPEQGADEPKEVWYLFGAWLLAATMNAILTWWGVSIAVVNHSALSTAVVDPQTITSVVPVFVAVMVWVIRILIIGTLSLALDRLLHPGIPAGRTAFQSAVNSHSQRTPAPQPARASHIPSSLGSAQIPPRPSVNSRAAAPSGSRPARFAGPAEEGDEIFEPNPAPARNEPTYHSLSARPSNGTTNDRMRRS